MSVVRQIVLIVSLMFVLVFTGTFYITVDNTRRFLAAQLESHAQDTATSLGLSLSQHFAEGDTLLMESMVDAIFDHGYYRSIVVEDISGHHLIDRVHAVRVQGVPEWFVHALPLVTPPASAKIMSGWRQGGTVTVVSHPGYAYAQLWRNAVDTLQWSLGSLALAILVTSIVIRIVLGPLRAVEAQAQAIAESEFPRVERIPRTRELRRVVLAMNSLAARMEDLLAGLSRRIRELRDQAYSDVLTGLGNRRAFERDVRQMVTRSEEHAFGAALAVAFEGLDVVNETHGYEAGDALIRAAAERLRDVVAAERWTLARVGGGLFTLVAPDLALDESTALAARLAEGMASVAAPQAAPAGTRVALAWYDGSQDDQTMLDELDAAIRLANEGPLNAWRMRERASDAPLPDLARLEARLRDVITNRAVVLHFQPVRSPDLARVLHLEVLARLPGEEGGSVPAGTFLPIAKRAGLAPALDRVIVLAALEHLQRRDAAAARFAINLSPGSVDDHAFVDWLGELVEREPALARRLDFEYSAEAAALAPEETLALAGALRRLGARFGIDHFGRGALGFDYLRGLKLAYAKIDGAFVSGIDVDEDHRAFVRGCVEAGRGAGIEVIAEFVETAAQLATLAEIGVAGVQGYHVGRPVEWQEARAGG